MAAAEAPLLAFCDSQAIDETGATVTRSYRSYYIGSGASGLGVSGVWPAAEFARRFLAERNLILNVSAVLWRRDVLLAALDACGDMSGWRLAGDWRLYLEVLTSQPGSMVYLAEPLNTHRRHDASVTQRLDHARHLAEIAEMHRVASASLGLAAAAQKAQAAYLERLAEQFAAAPKAAATRPAAPRRSAAIVARKR